MKKTMLLVGYLCLLQVAHAGSFVSNCLDPALSEQDRYTVDVILEHFGTEMCLEAELILLQRESLDLSGKQIESIAPLASMTHFKALDLHDNYIFDLTPLEELKHLEFLDVSRNDVEDIKVLGQLDSLVELRLSSNFIEDISSVIDLVNLQHLRLHDNYVTDIKPLAGLIQLQSLSLYSNDISDLSPIRYLSQLELFFSPLPNPIVGDADHCPVEDAFDQLVSFCQGYLERSKI